jgi:meso-butanediol dehydrogenase / (S,S)-butanediol dehydrogenase / diacetyl reductase
MGKAIAVRLADEGAKVLGVDIEEERLTDLQSLAPDDIAIRQADVGAPEECACAVMACLAEFGRIDILGNVAGIYMAHHVTDVTIEQWRRLMAVNLDAYFFMSQAAVPHLVESAGNVINIASNAGLHGVPYSVPYCISKGGVLQLTRALAVELIKTRVRVNAIAPAATNTNLSSTTSFPSDIDKELFLRYSGHRGRSEPEEVAGLFAFLASEEARSVTGAVYTIDNGLTVT